MAEVSQAESVAAMIELYARAFAGPGEAAARGGPSPQPMYVAAADASAVRDLGDARYSILSMEDLLHLTKHHAVEQGSKFLGSPRPAIPLGLDGPEHRKYRRLLDPIFTARRVAPLAGTVRALASDLLDSFVPDGEVDAYGAWCEPLPSTIFLSIMGLPSEDLADFMRFKSLILSNADPTASPEDRLARREQGVAWIQGYFLAELERRAAGGGAGDDVIGGLLAAEVDGHHLTQEEILDILGLLMVAGLDTVTSALSCFLAHLAQHPDQRERLVTDPALIRPAVEELMRFESPVPDGYRVTTGEVVLPSGTVIPAGADVHVSWAAANLDPAVFADPLAVDLDRQPNPHVGFAAGFHRCLGSHLARMEMVTALTVWHERIPAYQLAPGHQLHYAVQPRAPRPLPLVWS
ncbi:MAG: cytochrome P450 [Acidobacteria bacterium]|nr:cytochrome P450 [Acidobacteriota bacterium]